MGNRVYSGEDADIEESILMHGVVVQPGAIVRRAIIDKWTTIPSGAQIGVDLQADRKRFTVTESGIVCVPGAMTSSATAEPTTTTFQATPTSSTFEGA